MKTIELINNKNNLPELNLEEIIRPIIDELPLIKKTGIKNNDTILIQGEADDFEFFMTELNDKLPDEYYFENELKGENYNLCEIKIFKKLRLNKSIRTESKVESCLKDWEKLIKELDTDERKLSQLKEDYAEQEREIIKKTDFNKIYNANNDKIRKAHVKKELKPLADEKENLEFKINDSKRKLSLLKAKTYAEIELMKIIKQ